MIKCKGGISKKNKIIRKKGKQGRGSNKKRRRN